MNFFFWKKRHFKVYTEDINYRYTGQLCKLSTSRLQLVNYYWHCVRSSTNPNKRSLQVAYIFKNNLLFLIHSQRVRFRAQPKYPTSTHLVHAFPVTLRQRQGCVRKHWPGQLISSASGSCNRTYCSVWTKSPFPFEGDGLSEATSNKWVQQRWTKIEAAALRMHQASWATHSEWRHRSDVEGSQQGGQRLYSSSRF